MTLGRTMVLSQRHKGFPHRNAHGEIQDVSNNWIALRAWRVLQNLFLPSSDEDEDGDGKQQQVDDYRRVEHGDTKEARETLYHRCCQDVQESAENILLEARTRP